MIDGFEIGGSIDRQVAKVIKMAPPNRKNKSQYAILLKRLQDAESRIKERLERLDTAA